MELVDMSNVNVYRMVVNVIGIFFFAGFGFRSGFMFVDDMLSPFVDWLLSKFRRR